MSVKIIHRFWAGSQMPAEYKEFGQAWSELNPEWIVWDWDEASALSTLWDSDLAAVIADLYRRDAGRLGIEFYVQMADVIGYWLVFRYGGVYINCDMQPLSPLRGRLPDQAWAAKENDVDDRIVNAVIGAPEAKNPFWKSLLEELPLRYFSDPTAEMVQTTGPALLTDHAHERLGQLFVFPTHIFNPVHWSQIAPGGDAKGFTYPLDSIAVHHWGHKKDHRSNHVETGTQR